MRCRLEGHTDALECVAAHGASCATAGWDNTVRVWSWEGHLHDAIDSGEGDAKRARTGAGASAPATAHAVTEPAAALEGHTQAVSGLAFAQDGSLFSCSWDHSIRRWDVARGQLADSMATGKALLCVAAAPADAPAAGAGVAATGGADGTLRIWDSRAPQQETLVRLGAAVYARSNNKSTHLQRAAQYRTLFKACPGNA